MSEKVGHKQSLTYTMSTGLSHKGDVQTQAATLISQLKRRQIIGSHDAGLATARLLYRFVSANKFAKLGQLTQDVTNLGKRLVAAQPREFAINNVVQRVLAVIREVKDENGSALSQDISASGAAGPGGNAAGGAVGTTAQGAPSIATMFGILSSTSSYSPASDERKKSNSAAASSSRTADIIEGIQELIDEIENVDDTIMGMSVEMIHENEILLTPSSGSRTVLEFLLRAVRQKRNFTVLVVDSFPNESFVSQEFARKLDKAGIRTIIIPDTAIFAVMSQVGKVLIATRAIFPNGGCVSSAGVAMACECAREYRVPVLAVSSLYKVCPEYPFDIQSLIEMGDSSKVLPFTDGDLMDTVQVVNPTYDYVVPEHIDIYITNLGGYSPSFMYRIVMDQYGSAT